MTDRFKDEGAQLVTDIVRLIRNGKNDMAIDYAVDAIRAADAQGYERAKEDAAGVCVGDKWHRYDVLAERIRALTPTDGADHG